MARLMALDVGEVRIGVAVCDEMGILASPYTTLHVTSDEQQTWEALQHLLVETEAEALVIGLPISLDGQIHAQGERIQTFAERLRPYIHVPIIFQDERLSTVEARRLLAERGEAEGRPRRQSQARRQPHTRGKRPKSRQRGHEIDALAASIILKDYLAQHPVQTVSYESDSIAGE